MPLRNEGRRHSRNGAVDVYKFFFSLVICFYHFYESGMERLPMGYLGVEFFVLTAGIYFFTNWFKNAPGYSPVEGYLHPYIKNRFFRFFPYTSIAYVFSFVLIRLYPNMEKISGGGGNDIWLDSERCMGD